MTPRVSDKQIIEALYKSSGILSLTANYITKTYGVKITRQGIWNRIQSNPKLKEEQEKARELIKDGAEAVIVREIANGNWKVAMSVLKTLAKDRGYTERQEVTGADGTPLQPVQPRLFEIEFVAPKQKNAETQRAD